MNGCQIQASGAVDLYFYEELSGLEKSELEAHLAGCVECRGALAELKTIRTALAASPRVAAPPDGDWTSLMARIDVAVAHQPVQPAGFIARVPPGRHHSVVGYLAMAALLTLVTAAVGYLAQHQSGRPTGTPMARVAPGPPAREDLPGPGAPRPAAVDSTDPAFAAVSEQHFERSKLVILGLATRNAETASSSDWAYERQLAGALLDDTRLYKQAAEARGLGSLAGVMSDLELVLLQASMSDQRDHATLDRLQRLIQKRDLVSKMEMTRF